MLLQSYLNKSARSRQEVTCEEKKVFFWLGGLSPKNSCTRQPTFPLIEHTRLSYHPRSDAHQSFTILCLLLGHSFTLFVVSEFLYSLLFLLFFVALGCDLIIRIHVHQQKNQHHSLPLSPLHPDVYLEDAQYAFIFI
jgi:hypothetical protein